MNFVVGKLCFNKLVIYILEIVNNESTVERDIGLDINYLRNDLGYDLRWLLTRRGSRL